jgi:hypothetical protein
LDFAALTLAGAIGEVAAALLETEHVPANGSGVVRPRGLLPP